MGLTLPEVVSGLMLGVNGGLGRLTSSGLGRGTTAGGGIAGKALFSAGGAALGMWGRKNSSASIEISDIGALPKDGSIYVGIGGQGRSLGVEESKRRRHLCGNCSQKSDQIAGSYIVVLIFSECFGTWRE